MGAALAGAIYDVKFRRIPNLLTGPALIVGLLWAASHGGLSAMLDALLGSLLLLTPFLLLFVFAHGGAGDAKLMGAIGAWTGAAQGLVVLLSVLLAGALLGIGHVILKKQGRRFLNNMFQVAAAALALCHRGDLSGGKTFWPSRETMTPMPYGVAIFTGVCLALGVAVRWHI